ncbi:hypothetical protein JANAI62_19500 [Jannaschia pagri]|uniref:DoxX protein n=1 Tax=Jannaschia pagri TaxID=2829797 RepID=A0ABQ4NLP1_9RHOB|nr:MULTISPECIES: hypothetical protein [unclassified Jannaschia]GIT91493.1 hypothetical protein JANAI61_19510 [Jannaschia sp. AI_61]GIT95327.1 hypothetical protein JANAI62_19500 [Jannaschia sp. AI_62]
MQTLSSRSTAYGLFSIRVSLFLFMLAWALVKVTNPAAYAGEGIFATYYGTGLGTGLVLAIGVAQIAFLLAFVAGVARMITTGGVLAMNAGTLLVSLTTILPTYVGGGNLLFVASLPVFAASLALFLMRDQDTLLSVDAARASTVTA